MLRTFTIALLSASSQAITLRNMSKWGFDLNSVTDAVNSVVPAEVTGAATQALNTVVPEATMNNVGTALNAGDTGSLVAIGADTGANTAGKDTTTGQVLTSLANSAGGIS